MGELKAELSTKSKYWIPKHRYYELRHFCLQYPEWKRLYFRLDSKIVNFPGGVITEKRLKRPVEDLGIMREELDKNMKLIERVCKEADGTLWPYIFRAVTEGMSYTTLSMRYSMPCGKDMFYDRYRKFFWLLSGER